MPGFARQTDQEDTRNRTDMDAHLTRRTIAALCSLALLAAGVMSGCARPSTFASDPFQPPTVSPGYESAPPAWGAPPANTNPAYGNSNYVPPGQSYQYQGSPYQGSGNVSQANGIGGLSDPASRAAYEKYYGPSATGESSGTPPTTYPGGSSQGADQQSGDSGQNVTTNRPRTEPQNPFANNPPPIMTDGQTHSALDAENNNGGGSSAGDSANGGQPRPMVPIQRPSGGAPNQFDASHAAQGDPLATNRTTPLGGEALNGAPVNGTPNTGTLPNDTQGRPAAGAQLRTPSGAPPVLPPAGSNPSGWPNTYSPQGHPRQPVPLQPPATDNATGTNPASSGAPPVTPVLDNRPLATPASSYPPGGHWPQKPIPLPREAN